MHKTGVFVGKFLPPHRGHLSSIINSATQCETLYVVVRENHFLTHDLCKEAGLADIDGPTRVKWLSQELQGFPHIKVLMLDESWIPTYPDGWEEWSKALRRLIGMPIDVIFGGDPDYEAGYAKWMPEVEYKLFDYERTRYPISATKIRKEPFKYWDYILGSARPFFTKKVLIAGTESCGKTTLTKYLAKIFYTSWSEEVGRYYASEFLGGNENVYTLEDFGRIAYLQYECDMKALKTANKIVFFDTDAVVTQYYSKMFMMSKSDMVESFIDPDRYDVVLYLRPDVKWVDDGQRYNSDQKVREELDDKLAQMYYDYGFRNLYEVKGNYHERLERAISISKNLLGETP